MSTRVTVGVRWMTLVTLVLAVGSMAPGRCGRSGRGFFSGNPAPDLRGDWAITYQDDINVEIDVSGQVYTGTIAGTHGSFSFVHDGEEYTFELDCSRPAVICPSEVFPSEVTLEQRDFENHPHQVHMPVNTTECVGETRPPDPEQGECGGDTGISCDEEICDGTVVERTRDSLGAISDPEANVGDHPEYTLSVALGGTVAAWTTVNGVCVGLAASVASADIEYEGSYDPDNNNMYATELTNGEVSLVLAGGCLIAGASGGTGAAALADAQVRLSTSFTASRSD